MPSKKISFSDEKSITRKYKLTYITEGFLNDLLKRKGFGEKDKSELIVSCINSFYAFFKENASLVSGKVQGKKANDPSNEPDAFSMISCINLIMRGHGGDFVYVKMPLGAIEKLDEMIDFVEKKYEFNSPSSIVNHAIAFEFEDQANALEEYVISSGLTPIL